MNNSNIAVLYTYWSEVYHLVWNDLNNLLLHKLKQKKEVDQWLCSQDFTKRNPEEFKRNQSYYYNLAREVSILKATWCLLPEVKKAYDDYLFWLAKDRDSLKDELIAEIIRLKGERNG